MYAQLMVVYDPKENKQKQTNKHSFDYVAINQEPVYFVFS